MSLSDDVIERAARFLVPGMGTENVAWLCYTLIRMTRSQRVIEVGAGYTTFFIAQALADNRASEECERRQLAAKTERLAATRETLGDGDGQDAAGAYAFSNALADWECEPPPLAWPDHYGADYTPRLDAIDDLSAGDLDADALGAALSEAGLADIANLHRRSFRGFRADQAIADGAIDLAWFDCGGYAEYVDFLEEFWPAIDPDGGMILLHSTLNNFHLSHIVKDLKMKQMGDGFGRFELMSLLEPHKYRQNSVTMIRMTRHDPKSFLWADRLSDLLSAT